MSNETDESNPFLLFANEFTQEDRADLLSFDCGDEPWSKAASQWIRESDVWDSMQRHGTAVWLYRNHVGVVVGFGSLGLVNRRWPPPDGRYCRFLYIPMIGIDRTFHGQPPDNQFRYSHQIMSHLRYEALQLLQHRMLEGRETLPMLALQVHRDNLRAQKLYSEFGFQVEGTTQRDQLLMTQMLSIRTP